MKMMRVESFAKTHSCDPEWVEANRGTRTPVFDSGERVLLAGSDSTAPSAAAEVLRHVRNDRFMVRADGEEGVVSAALLSPESGYRWTRAGRRCCTGCATIRSHC
jgi:hypothetical protein